VKINPAKNAPIIAATGQIITNNIINSIEKFGYGMNLNITGGKFAGVKIKKIVNAKTVIATA